MNSESPSKKDDDYQKSIACHVIRNIIKKFKLQGIPSPEQVYSAIEEITEYFPYLPPDLKQEAEKIFEALFNKKTTSLSTDKYLANDLTNIDVPKQLEPLVSILDEKDRSIVLGGIEVLRLIKIGAHTKSERIKKNLLQRYGQRREKIFRITTTGDIYRLLREQGDDWGEDEKLNHFNFWIENYYKIAVLVSPEELNQPEQVKKRVLETAKSAVRNYIVIHISGSNENCDQLLDVVKELKEEERLKYEELKPTIKESGFKYEGHIKLLFQDIEESSYDVDIISK